MTKIPKRLMAQFAAIMGLTYCQYSGTYNRKRFAYTMSAGDVIGLAAEWCDRHKIRMSIHVLHDGLGWLVHVDGTDDVIHTNLCRAIMEAVVAASREGKDG